MARKDRDLTSGNDRVAGRENDPQFSHDTTHHDTTTADATRRAATHDANRDPLSGEPGAHPVGTGVGAAGGGLAGVAIGGAIGGPVGAAIGGAIGAAAGGLAGKGIAEGVNPTEEDAYWRENYRTRDYADSNLAYDQYQPAYRYGWESRGRYADRKWDQAQNDLERGWDKARGESKLTWQQAKNATRDAWDRVERRSADDAYWRENYRSRGYSDPNRTYDEYAPAYRYGSEARDRYRGRDYNEVENDLERGWDRAKGESKLGWQEAKGAVRDAWHRVERAMPGDADNDGR